jgi:hypothetical protein
MSLFFMQNVISKTTLEVCEQQWDVDFETHDVSHSNPQNDSI